MCDNFLFDLVMCLAITSVYAVDYCGDELKCREGPHVGCNKTIGVNF